MPAKRKTTPKKAMRRRAASSRGTSKRPKVTAKSDPELYAAAIEAIIPMVCESRPKTQIRDVLRGLLNDPDLTLARITEHIRAARAVMREAIGVDKADLVAEQATWYRARMAGSADDHAAIRAAENFDKVMGLDPKHRSDEDLSDDAMAARLRALLNGMEDGVPEMDDG